MAARVFFEDRLNIQKMTKENRDILFVEVSQPDLQKNIFIPLYNLYSNETHFFPKRFAILGHFKTGKTELGKYIIDKLSKHYPNCVSLTINSKMAQYKTSDEIDDWIYSQWYIQLLQVDVPGFRECVKSKLEEFRDIHGGEPREFLDKIFLICAIYRKFLEKNPDAKFVVVIDQANVITEEAEFHPFFEFWRNFQGYWENDKFFSELPILIFVIGHKNWMEFAALKDPIGRGVFDTWVEYNYWNNTDIEQMYRKRLTYALKPEDQKQLLKYFLCNGIVDFFGKKLGQASTQEYLDQFFGYYLRNFLADFQTNFSSYTDFLDYCKKETSQKRSDDTYFQEVEKTFTGTPALDYMPVFRYLSDNQNEKWFEELFALISDLYEKNSMTYTSRDFMKYTNLSKVKVSTLFASSSLTGMKPEYNPPLFAEYQDKLILNESFKDCLAAIGACDSRGPIFLLKRYVKSTRIKHEVFVESRDGAKMGVYLKTIATNAGEIFSLVQKWVINKVPNIIQEEQVLDEVFLSVFYKIRHLAQQLTETYKKNSTNWGQFDNYCREIASTLLEKTFPPHARVSQFLDTQKLIALRDEILSPRSSNLAIAKSVSEMLGEYFHQLQGFEKTPTSKVPTIKKRGILVVIDGPNALGENFKDRLNLKDVAEFAQKSDRNAKLLYFTKIDQDPNEISTASRLGYKSIVRHKDIDSDIKNEIREFLLSSQPPETIILGTKDQDFTDFVKQIRKEFDVKFILAISSPRGLAGSLRQAFSEDEIKFFPEKLKVEVEEEDSDEEIEAGDEDEEDSGEIVYTFQMGTAGDPIAYHSSGKICLPDRAGKNQPRVGERWFCNIKQEKGSCIVLYSFDKFS